MDSQPKSKSAQRRSRIQFNKRQAKREQKNEGGKFVRPLPDDNEQLDHEDQVDTDDRDLPNDDKDVVASDRAKADSAPKKYVPPHKRQKMEPVVKQAYLLSEQTLKLARSNLNKIVQQNFPSIAKEIEQLFEKNSRNELIRFITDEIIERCKDVKLDHTAALPSWMALIAVLHTVFGIGIGSYFVEQLVNTFQTEVLDGISDTKASKMMASALSGLYIFGAIENQLIWDALDRLIDRFDPQTIPLILHLIRISGSDLRKEAPAQLKKFIEKVQAKTSELGISLSSDKKSSTSTSTPDLQDEINQFDFQVRFMLQTIYDLKNNRQQLEVSATYFSTMKPVIRDHLQKIGMKASAPINIGWTDLLDAKTRGRWWLVGSAWAGVGDTRQSQTNETNTSTTSIEKIMGGDVTELIALAKQQRMNTEVRRNVFCAVMSSSDYQEAISKIEKLRIPHKQEKEVLFVIIHCSMMEDSFNQYYVHLTHFLCLYQRQMKINLQFALWDRFKMMSTLHVKSVSNLGQYVAHLIGRGSADILVLKVLDFLNGDTKSDLFLRQVFQTLFLEFEKEDVTDVFKMLLKTNMKEAVGLASGLRIFFTKEALALEDKATDPRTKVYLAGTKYYAPILDRVSGNAQLDDE